MKKTENKYDEGNHLHTLIAEVGYLKGVIEGIDEKVTKQNGSVAKLQEKVAGYDIWFGKFGAGMAVLAVIFSFVINLVVDFLRRWLTGT